MDLPRSKEVEMRTEARRSDGIAIAIDKDGSRGRLLRRLVWVMLLSLWGFLGLPPSSTLGVAADSLPQYWWPYSMTSSWPSVRAGPNNWDYGRENPADSYEVAWVTLEGASLLGAPIPDEEGGLFYLITRRSDEPNLTAYRLADGEAGEVVWESGSYHGWELGPPAITSSPLIDVDGNLYISDGRAFWSFTPNGEVRWRTRLPTECPGGVDDGCPERRKLRAPFITAFFLPTGEVGGVTSFGRALIYDRETGAKLAELVLSGRLAPREEENQGPAQWMLSECLWIDEEGEPMMDDEMRIRMLNGFLGVGTAVANTPVVLRRTEGPYTASIVSLRQACTVRLFSDVSARCR
jgi:hypothetical protein